MPLCEVSLDEYSVDGGVTCTNGHFVGADSFSIYVEHFLRDSLDKFIERGHVIPCAISDCRCVHTTRDCIDHLEPAAYALYLQALPENLRVEAENLRINSSRKPASFGSE